MQVRNAGMDVAPNKENVPGVVLMDGVVGKIGLQEMAVMAHLVEITVMNAFSNQFNSWNRTSINQSYFVTPINYSLLDFHFFLLMQKDQMFAWWLIVVRVSQHF